jgi:hypothetical protein
LQDAWRNLLNTEYVIDVAGVQMVSLQQLKNVDLLDMFEEEIKSKTFKRVQ